MLTGKPPDPLTARVLDVCLILHAEHTMNASTFSGLVTASTLADAYTVVSSAIGTLMGPLHGGANEEVLLMLREIGSPEKARAYLDRQLAAGEKIMGLGHREYKVKDPRAVILQSLAKELFARFGKSPLYEVAEAVEREALTRLSSKGVYPNVDFYSGIVYQKDGPRSRLFHAGLRHGPGRRLAGALGRADSGQPHLSTHGNLRRRPRPRLRAPRSARRLKGG
jgi:citrate synthase